MPDRPKRLSCLTCGRDIVVSPIGRLPKYCSEACRQRSYVQRQAKAEVTEPVAPTPLQEEIRQVVWAVLIEAGLIAGMEPAPPRRRR